MWGCQPLRFKAVSKGKLTIPKDLVTQSSEGLVCLTVYNQHFLIGLKTNKTTDHFMRNLNSMVPLKHQNIVNRENAHVVFNLYNNHEIIVKTYRDRLTFMLKPLLWVKVCQFPPRHEGITNIQAHFLQTGQLCTL